MKFWDTSALIPLLFTESASTIIHPIVIEDGAMVVWWAAPVECWSAAARLRREGQLDQTSEEQIRQLLAVLRSTWIEILPGEEIRSVAGGLLLRHPLRAADALQLAAALIWANKSGAGHHFVCLDKRLREAAWQEGFRLLPEMLPQ